MLWAPVMPMYSPSQQIIPASMPLSTYTGFPSTHNDDLAAFGPDTTDPSSLDQIPSGDIFPRKRIRNINTQSPLLPTMPAPFPSTTSQPIHYDEGSPTLPSHESNLRDRSHSFNMHFTYSDNMTHGSEPSPDSGNSANTPLSKTSSKAQSLKPDTDNARVQKRNLNTQAARRYRQKRVDLISNLETTLQATQTERDELKMRVARLEGELEILKGLVGSKS